MNLLGGRKVEKNSNQQKTISLLLLLADEQEIETQEDKLTSMVKLYVPKSTEELLETELENLTAAKGKTYYDQLFQQGKTDGKK